MRILLTGGTGFVGKYFQEKFECIPLSDEMGEPIDIRDYGKISKFVGENPCHHVLHLAAMSFVPWSFENPRETFEINFLGTFNLIHALKENGFKGRLLYIGSADQYGIVPEEKLPIDEDTPLKPRNPYAVSKMAAEALCFQSSQTESFEIIMARPFNHIGKGQSPSFVISDIARQISQISKGLKEPSISVGDIDVTRDFTDVRDVVDAYLLLLNDGKNGEVYNVCSGKEYKIRTLIYSMLEMCGLKVEIKKDPGKFRKSEQRRVVGNFQKIKKDLGWEPKYSIEKALQDILDYWKGIV